VKGLPVIAHRAMLDVCRELAQFVGRLLRAERRRRGTRKASRALTCYWQAVLGLRWFRHGGDKAALGRDHGISRATAYRYIDEVTEVLAAWAPQLREVLERAETDGLAYVILDGKIFSADRCGEQTTSVKGDQIDLWYSGKTHQGHLCTRRIPAVGLPRRTRLHPRLDRRPTTRARRLVRRRHPRSAHPRRPRL